jgi:hypothetical protein
MELAEKLGLSVETINQAAAFFVQKLEFSSADLPILKKSKKAVIYRPTFPLYLKLKASRLTESDLTDLEHYFSYCVGVGDKIDLASTRKSVAAILNHGEHSLERLARLKKLSNLLA